MSQSLPFINIAAYKFVTFTNAAQKRPEFLALCQALSLKGTILLSPEGINIFLAGMPEAMEKFLEKLRLDPRFEDIVVKKSYSAHQPFRRMVVKYKAEIITMRHPLIQPEKKRAPAVSPKTLKRWLDTGHDDEGRPVVMMDTRNAFEVDVGSFHQAIDYRIRQFTDFPQVVAADAKALRDKTVVTFCTGGIRCEKAAIHMQNVGYARVYQLDGGILNYFEHCGDAHYRGDCFVFDDRTAVNAALKQTDFAQCYACRAVLTAQEQTLPSYKTGQSCCYCVEKKTPKVAA